MVKDNLNAMTTPAGRSLTKISLKSEIAMHKNAPQNIQCLRFLDYFITHQKGQDSRLASFSIFIV